MTDDCISDLCLVGVERDIDLNFEHLIDKQSSAHPFDSLTLF